MKNHLGSSRVALSTGSQNRNPQSTAQALDFTVLAGLMTCNRKAWPNTKLGANFDVKAIGFEEFPSVASQHSTGWWSGFQNLFFFTVSMGFDAETHNLFPNMFEI